MARDAVRAVLDRVRRRVAGLGDAAAKAAPDASVAVGSGSDSSAPPPVVRKIYVDKIPDVATFEAYSKELGGERFSKFVYDLKTDAIYYFDVNVYPVHKDFIFGALYKKPKTPAAVHRVDHRRRRARERQQRARRGYRAVRGVVRGHAPRRLRQRAVGVR